VEVEGVVVEVVEVVVEVSTTAGLEVVDAGMVDDSMALTDVVSTTVVVSGAVVVSGRLVVSGGFGTSCTVSPMQPDNKRTEANRITQTFIKSIIRLAGIKPLDSWCLVTQDDLTGLTFQSKLKRRVSTIR
jgi:hypothetical protein